jgi:tetratricopeptide (TPR) repeat protein
MNKNPNDIDLILNYGKILYETGKKEEAESYFKKSLEISPDNKPALRTLARFYVIDLRDFIRGLEVLNKLVQLETDSPEIWELIGICQANLQNKDGAEEAFKKAESLRKTTP